MNNADVLFCRNAIINNRSETTAYHLMCPNETIKTDEYSFFSSLFIDVSLSEVVQQKKAFIDCRIDDIYSIPEQDSTEFVFFLNAHEIITDHHKKTLSELRRQGYRFGIMNPPASQLYEESLSLFSFVKFDLSSLNVEEIIEEANQPHLIKKQIWINEIDNAEQLSILKENIGNDAWFSGSFIKKKSNIKGKKIIAYKAILIDLLSAIKSKESSFTVLAQYIERDPTLTYRIIKLTQNAKYKRAYEVSTAQKAVSIIGLKDLSKWVALAMLGSVSGKPDCLFSMAISRAFFCQSISAVLFPKLNGAFLVGLFSYLPSFLDESLPTLLKELPVDVNISSALLEYQGNLGGILKMVEAYESGRWEKIPFELLESKNLTKPLLKSLYVESLKQAREMKES